MPIQSLIDRFNVLVIYSLYCVVAHAHMYKYGYNAGRSFAIPVYTVCVIQQYIHVRVANSWSAHMFSMQLGDIYMSPSTPCCIIALCCSWAPTGLRPCSYQSYSRDVSFYVLCSCVSHVYVSLYVIFITHLAGIKCVNMCTRIRLVVLYSHLLQCCAFAHLYNTHFTSF